LIDFHLPVLAFSFLDFFLVFLDGVPLGLDLLLELGVECDDFGLLLIAHVFKVVRVQIRVLVSLQELKFQFQGLLLVSKRSQFDFLA
jgi:hypothetical protein